MRAQSNVLKEIFNFLIGCFIFISTFYLFEVVIVPPMQSYVVGEQLKDVQSHVDLLCTEACMEAAGAGYESNFTLYIDMPDTLANYHYIAYFISNQLCTRALGYTSAGTSPVWCRNVSLPSGISYKGSYFSGDKMVINCARNSSLVQLTLSSKSSIG